MIGPVPDPMLMLARLYFNRFGAAMMAAPKGILDNLREQLASVTNMLAQ